MKIDYWLELPTAIIDLLGEVSSDQDKQKSRYLASANYQMNLMINKVDQQMTNILNIKNELKTDNNQLNLIYALKLRIDNIQKERTAMMIQAINFSISLLNNLSEVIENEINLKKSELDFKLLNKIKLTISIVRTMYAESLKYLAASVKKVNDEKSKINCNRTRTAIEELANNEEYKTVYNNDNTTNFTTTKNENLKENTNLPYNKDDPKDSSHLETESEGKRSNIDSICISSHSNTNSSSNESPEFNFFYVVKVFSEKIESKFYDMSMKLISNTFKHFNYLQKKDKSIPLHDTTIKILDNGSIKLKQSKKKFEEDDKIDLNSLVNSRAKEKFSLSKIKICSKGNTSIEKSNKKLNNIVAK